MKKYLEAESIQLVYNGHNYFGLLEQMIDASKMMLHFQTYIFETDITGMRIVNALKRTTSFNISIYLPIDTFVSKSFSRNFKRSVCFSDSFSKTRPVSAGRKYLFRKETSL
jgi:hypothetical protein